MRISDWSSDVCSSDLANRNRLDAAPLNSTFGGRFTLGGQLSRTIGRHRLTAAVEHEAEDFRARDQSFFGATDQDRSRELTAFVGEWRADWWDNFAPQLGIGRAGGSEIVYPDS